MPYRGKPSLSCDACRPRRAKCDLKRPACTQCIRKKIACPGYRDITSLLFRDESNIVAQKYGPEVGSSTSADSALFWVPRSAPELPADDKLDGKPTDSKKSDEREPDYLASHPDRWDFSGPTGPPTNALAQSVEFLAAAYFITIYLPSSSFEYLPALATPALLESKPLSTTLLAASLACFSQSTHHPHPSSALRLARQTYVLALKQTNSLLADPACTVLDSMLISVLLLGLVEAVCFRGRTSPTSWCAHAHGALALLRARGHAQIATPLGRALLTQVGSNIRTSCMLSAEPVPAVLLDLQARVLYHHPTDWTARFTGFMDHVIEVRTAWARFRPEDRAGGGEWHGVMSMDSGQVDGLLAFLELARGVDRLGEDLLAEIPATWTRMVPKTAVPASIDVFEDLDGVEMYANHTCAKLLLSIRMLRVFLNERIWACTRQLLTSEQDGSNMAAWLADVREGSEQTYKQCVFGILAAVPHFLGQQDDTMMADMACGDPDLYSAVYTGAKPSPGMMQRFLIWPLAIIGQSEVTVPAVREYVLAQLGKLFRSARLQQAAGAVEMLQESIGQEDWLHLAFNS